jgi:cytochrome c peroxidase
MFKAAFGDHAITEERIIHALASFVRSIRSGNAPYDRYEAGDESAIDDAAKRGWLVFRDKGGCTACHVPPLFTDNAFHNIGVGFGADGGEPDPGRFVVTKKKGDMGRFKTPTLRSVSRTSPYFHDGSKATLEGAVDYVLSGGHENPQRDQALAKLELTAQQKSDLLTFLRSLDGAE